MVKYGKRKGRGDMFEERLEIMIWEEKERLKSMKEELKRLDGGTLNKRIKGSRYYFMERIDGKQKGITCDKEKIHRLARKGYLMNMVSLREENIRIAEKALIGVRKVNERDKRDGYVEKFSMLSPEFIIYSETERKWINNRQSCNPYKREFLRYGTNNGVLMRSKSERFIGNYIEEKNLIYMYEPEVIIDGRPIYPDFMIRSKSGRIVMWEHFGLMDNSEYYNKAMEKIREYRRIGYVQHDNLICTYEEDLESIENLEKIYRRFLME